MSDDLSSKTCLACNGDLPVLEKAAAEGMMAQLNEGWEMANDGRAIVRRVTVRDFNAGHHCANLAAWLGEQEGHHPDIRFGWGYCEVEFTTHVVRGLTENDFICAAKFDRLLLLG